VRLQQRPEADDVKAMQTQMASLHLVMEQSSNEHERRLAELRQQLGAGQGEREKLERECLELKRKLEDAPGVEEVAR